MSTDVLAPLQGVFDREKIGTPLQSSVASSGCPVCGPRTCSPVADVRTTPTCGCSHERKRPQKKRNAFMPSLQHLKMRRGDNTAVANKDTNKTLVDAGKNRSAKSHLVTLRVEIMSESVDMSESLDSLACMSDEAVVADSDHTSEHTESERAEESVESSLETSSHRATDADQNLGHNYHTRTQNPIISRKRSESNQIRGLNKHKIGRPSSKSLLGLPSEYYTGSVASLSRLEIESDHSIEKTNITSKNPPHTKAVDLAAAYAAVDTAIPMKVRTSPARHRRTRSAFAPIALEDTKTAGYKAIKVSRRVSFDPSEYKYSTYSKNHYTRGFDAYSYYRNMGVAEKMQVMREIRAVKPGAQYETLKYLGMFMLVVLMLCVQNYIIPALVA